MRVLNLIVTLLLLAPQAHVHAQPPKPASPPRFEFTRLVAHWTHYGTDDYLKFIAEAKPEVAQIGNYGGHFYSLVHTPEYAGYPSHFPVRGLDECGKFLEQRNADLHKLGVKVVGHFNYTFLIGEPETPEGPRGFFKFYRDLWNEKELGPKPVADPLSFISRNADGSPYTANHYSVGKNREWTACLNNPDWRKVLKAWTKRGIERGVDGFVANYFYRHNCLCEHCQTKFRSYLGGGFTAEQMKERFAIEDVKTHKFTEIVGWHNPKESTPLRREMLRFSQLSTKEAFDDVWTQYGRSLKPDLITAQWNHLGDLSAISGDERTMLPAEIWGKDETYLWYSTGGSACYTDLAAGHLGEGTLHARYIRGTFDDKPFTLGKYEQTRIRVAIAELAANGGAPMGFYTNFSDPAARQEIVRYYRFMGDNDAIYKASTSHAEVSLVFPRSKVHASGDVEAVVKFKEVGKDLLNKHVLFDVIPDDMLTDAIKAKYQTVIDPATPFALPADLSRFRGPATVRVSASKPAAGQEITLHFVNYNREEPSKPKSAGSGIHEEKPIEVESMDVDFAVPKGASVAKVLCYSPELPKPVEVKFTVQNGRVQFSVPKFLVYSIARVQLAGS